MTTSYSDHPGDSHIPVDLFGSKKHPGLAHGDRGFTDASGNIVFTARRQSSHHQKRVILDATGNPILSIYRYNNGCWKCYKGESDGDKNMVFRVKRTLKTFSRIELEVFLVGENMGESTCDLKVRGSPFMRSCTICSGDTVVAQTSLMHKLHQIYVKRSKFRLTIFPGSLKHDLVVALIVIFLDGQK